MSSSLNEDAPDVTGSISEVGNDGHLQSGELAQRNGLSLNTIRRYGQLGRIASAQPIAALQDQLADAVGFRSQPYSNARVGLSSCHPASTRMRRMSRGRSAKSGTMATCRAVSSRSATG